MVMSTRDDHDPPSPTLVVVAIVADAAVRSAFCGLELDDPPNWMACVVGGVRPQCNGEGTLATGT